MAEKNKNIVTLIPETQSPADYFENVTGISMKDLHEMLGVLDACDIAVNPEEAEEVLIHVTPVPVKGRSTTLRRTTRLEGGGYTVLSMRGTSKLDLEVGDSQGDGALKGTFDIDRDVDTGSFDLTLVPPEHWKALTVARDAYREEQRRRQAQRAGRGILGRQKK